MFPFSAHLIARVGRYHRPIRGFHLFWFTAHIIPLEPVGASGLASVTHKCTLIRFLRFVMHGRRGRVGFRMSDRPCFESVMPFANINNFELGLEIESVRTSLKNRLENNGFNDFLRDYHDLNLDANVRDVNSQYYDIEEFNNITKDNSHIACSMIHMNIHRIAKNKGELLTLLSVIDLKFDNFVRNRRRWKQLYKWQVQIDKKGKKLKAWGDILSKFFFFV